MKLRKSFSYRRRKKSHDEEQVYPRIDMNTCSDSNSNLMKPVKSKHFLQRQRRSSSSSTRAPAQLSDTIKSKVFEPRYDVHSDDDEDEPFSSSRNSRTRPLDRLTYQIRQSFRNTLSRPRSRLESTNSNKRLISTKNPEIPTLHPSISTGLTSPLTISVENNPIKQRKAPSTYQSTSLSKEINSEPTQYFNRSFRTRFSFLRKKRSENHPVATPSNPEHANKKATLTERFHSLRQSFHLGTRHSSNKGKRHLLSDD